VIDATGDADVADRAGAPTVKTPVEEMQAASVMFHLAGVDKAAFLAGVAADPQTYDWSSGELTYLNLVATSRTSTSRLQSELERQGVRLR
jgi:hypothetical protein